jgi:hypothetical protein
VIVVTATNGRRYSIGASKPPTKRRRRSQGCFTRTAAAVQAAVQKKHVASATIKSERIGIMRRFFQEKYDVEET